MFTRDAMLQSDWYRERLKSQQTHEAALYEKHVASLERFLQRDSHREVAQALDIEGRLATTRAHLNRVRAETYLDELIGTIGRQPVR